MKPKFILIAAILIGYNVLNIKSADAVTTNEKELKENMLQQGDVQQLDFIRNKNLIRIYIKTDSFSRKPFYQEKFKNNIASQKPPQFEFKISDWESFQKSLTDFYKDKGISEVPVNVKDEGEWFGPIANTLVSILLFVGLFVLLMRKVGVAAREVEDREEFSILENQGPHCLIKARK